MVRETVAELARHALASLASIRPSSPRRTVFGRDAAAARLRSFAEGGAWVSASPDDHARRGWRWTGARLACDECLVEAAAPSDSPGAEQTPAAHAALCVWRGAVVSPFEVDDDVIGRAGRSKCHVEDDEDETLRLSRLGWEVKSPTAATCELCAQVHVFTTLKGFEPKHRWFCPRNSASSRNSAPSRKRTSEASPPDEGDASKKVKLAG
ncbi:hypothetical protein M885DRAFT_521504 [Pelagophyceae sp. CCMP2097]|nr:hypothetical protein M885DRAFT_521504 [Pelagophyceae sp. CCMP2097]